MYDLCGVVSCISSCSVSALGLFRSGSAERNPSITGHGKDLPRCGRFVEVRERAVDGLSAEDFKVLDNKAPQKVTSFAALGGSKAPVEVVVVLDAINAPSSRCLRSAIRLRSI